MKLINVGIFYGGHAFAVQHLLNVENALTHLLEGHRRDEAGDRLHSRFFFQDAGGIAVGVAVDRTGAGVRCARGDVGQLEGARVGDSVMAGGVDEPDGIVGGDGVEIGGGNVTVFGELALVPAGADDPFARLDENGLGLHTGDDFSYRSRIRELDAIEFFDTSVSDMGVGVDKSGSGGTTVEVDDTDAGSIARELHNLGVATDLHDNAVADSNGLGNRIICIHGEDVTVN